MSSVQSKTPRRSLVERLIALSVVNAESGCREWRGLIDKDGYGRITVGSKTDNSCKNERAHRVAYATFIGSYDKRLCVCHKCDNKRCINPDHLFLGTRKENNRDRDLKGRHSPLVGERQNGAKLTEGAVIDIRRSSLSRRLLAQKYNVTKTTIRDVKSYRTWRHI